MAQTEGTDVTSQLRQLADEIRVRVHLAGMDAKDAWAKLEPRVHDFERRAAEAADRVGEELRELGHNLKEELTKLRDRVQNQ